MLADKIVMDEWDSICDMESTAIETGTEAGAEAALAKSIAKGKRLGWRVGGRMSAEVGFYEVWFTFRAMHLSR